MAKTPTPEEPKNESDEGVPVNYDTTLVTRRLASRIGQLEEENAVLMAVVSQLQSDLTARRSPE